MKKMYIYEPALCCETGLCGVNIDSELLRISTVLNTLKQEGVVVERYNLNNAPMEFVKNNIVNQYVNEKGVDGLPVVVVDGEIVIAGRYPANDEILTLLGLPAEILLPKGATSCCCGEDESKSCCCDTNSTENCCDTKEEDNNNGSCCCGGNCC